MMIFSGFKDEDGNENYVKKLLFFSFLEPEFSFNFNNNFYLILLYSSTANFTQHLKLNLVYLVSIGLLVIL